MTNIIRSMLFALALCLAGFSARAADEPAAARPTPAEVQARLQEIAQKLDLTDEQKAQITPILVQEVADLKALQEDTSMRRIQKARKAREIAQASGDQVRALLTPDQQKKYDKLRDEARENARDRLRDRANQRGTAPASP